MKFESKYAAFVVRMAEFKIAMVGLPRRATIEESDESKIWLRRYDTLFSRYMVAIGGGRRAVVEIALSVLIKAIITSWR